MRIISAAILTWGVWGLGIALVSPIIGATIWRAPHVFPDGYVDRAVRVVISDRTVKIEYSVGMNDNTIKQLLDRWQSESSLAESIAANQSVPGPVELPPGTAFAADNLIDGNSDNISTEDGNFKNDEVLVANFREIAPAQFKKGLRVTCNGKEIELQPAPNPAGLRRHMTLTAEYEFTLPDTPQPEDLLVVDNNLGKHAGAIRMSLKATGDAILTKSNVAPIIVRATPVELAELSDIERRQATTIAGQIVHVSE